MAEHDIGPNRVSDHSLLGAAPEGEVVTVRVDGEELQGIAGEPIAATLLAHGIRTFRTMPGSDAPRGLFTGVGRSADELMTVDGELSVQVTVTPLRAGMEIATQRGLGQWREVAG
jgi:hypothetical protein